MLVFMVNAGGTGTEDKSAMGQAGMIPGKFLCGNEMNGRVIISEIVRHFDDLFFDLCRVGSFLEDNEAFTGVLLSG